MESPAEAGYQSGRKNRQAMGIRDRDRNKVGKTPDHVSRKAAIVYLVPVP